MLGYSTTLLPPLLQLIGGAQPQIMQPAVNGMVHVEEMSSLPPVAPQPIVQAPVPTPVQPAPVTPAQPPVASAPLAQPIPQAPVEEPITMPEESAEDVEEPVETHVNEQEEENVSLGATQDEKEESPLHESFEDQPSETGELICFSFICTKTLVLPIFIK